MKKNYLQTLVLNADFTPFALWDAKKAFCKIFGETSLILIENYDEYYLDGRGNKWPIPSVIALKDYVYKKPKQDVYNRTYVYIRDNMKCQYCNCALNSINMSIDHVYPKSLWKKEKRKGSYNSYTNVVACCTSCNTKKGDKTPSEAGMKLLKEPGQISRDMVLQYKLRNSFVPETWKAYINVQKKEKTASS